MTGRKFNHTELVRVAMAGNSVKEIAAAFGVVRSAVSKRLKALKIAIAKDITLRGVPKLLDNGLNAMLSYRFRPA